MAMSVPAAMAGSGENAAPTPAPGGGSSGTGSDNGGPAGGDGSSNALDGCFDYQYENQSSHACHRHAHWAKEHGIYEVKRRAGWYGAMPELVSVRYEDATVHDFQLYFHCGGQPGGHQRDCNAAPCTCTARPC
eukprot:SAG22_NODE_1244_length_5021_cov_16.855547_4_plen_133_part_00